MLHAFSVPLFCVFQLFCVHDSLYKYNLMAYKRLLNDLFPWCLKKSICLMIIFFLYFFV